MLAILTVMTQLGLAIAAILAAWHSWRTATKVQEIHVAINGRFAQLLKMAQELGRVQAMVGEKDRVEKSKE